MPVVFVCLRNFSVLAVCAPHMCCCRQRPEEDAGSPRTQLSMIVRHQVGSRNRT